MKKQYYSIQDVINFYAQREVSLDLQAISNCVREGFIHPLIYIDSRRVYACESRGKEGIIAIGFCHLSAYQGSKRSEFCFCKKGCCSDY